MMVSFIFQKNTHVAAALAVLLLMSGAAFSSGNDENDKVTSLPGYDGNNLCWNHYAGYLPATRDHQLFYWYHEATTNPTEKPLVLWLNGGPGCSSLGGMFTELGPFVLDENLKVSLNPYSFNVAANVLFIEQPAGVGFSYPNGPANDQTTAEDTVWALQTFLEKFPDLKGRPLYVMGESYGGHYVPNTVKQIQDLNKNVSPDQQINIQGFAVGNGYTDWQLDFNANVENGRFHALCSESQWQAANQACQGDFARCFWPRDDVDCPKECRDAVEAATTYAMDGSIDIYDIYEDVCLHNDKVIDNQLSTLLGYRKEALSRLSYENKPAVQDATPARQQRRHHRSLQTSISPIFPTCIDDYTEQYLNTPEVQTAIHIRPNTIPNGRWKDCGNVQYTFNYESELDNYKQWTAAGDLNILIYNGDADYILSHMGNSAWINQGLKLPKLKEWTPWKGSDGQVAGYFETYQTAGVPFSFLTVKGAGHMVPKDRPRHALDMLKQFLKGNQSYDEVERSDEVQPLCPSS